ncbi:hypothetical protein [Formosa sp. S-31]|uniref:hypothetical protein n=1 Tax=Formosa sp. S-31 TaxID=2790949 RepID=UPI003EB91725
MKKVLIFAVLVVFGLNLKAENTNPVLVNVGDVATLGAPSAVTYSAVKFPQKNFLLKRGAIVNYNSLAGVQVQVVKVKENNGNKTVVLKRADGRKFFNVLSTVTVDVDKAVQNNELLLVSYLD